MITKEGPRPIAIGDLPVAVRGLVQQINSFERMAAEAAVTGDYHKALVAMTINPLVPSDTIAKNMWMIAKCAMKDIRSLKQSRNTKRATQIKVALSIYYLSNLRVKCKKNG